MQRGCSVRTGRKWRTVATTLVAAAAAIGLLVCTTSAGAAGSATRRAQGLAPRSDTSPIYVVPTTSTTALTVTPHSGVTNQTMTLGALVASSSSLVPPSGAVTFYRGAAPLNGCAAEPVATQSQSTTVTCQASFAASTSPEPLRAVFVPVSGSGMAGSNASTVVTVNRGPTSIGLKASRSTATVGTTVRFTATPKGMPGPVSVSGMVSFRDGAKKLRGCTRRPLRRGRATCVVTYRTTGQHQITAVYNGDRNFLASRPSKPQSVQVLALGTITSAMQWTFVYRPTYTEIRAFSINAVPAGATVVVNCRGTGCPFATQSRSVPGCGRTPTRNCSRSSQNIGLEPSFHRRRLRVGTAVSVRILRPGWIGKYYLFTMLAGRGPSIQISCLAPGQTVPGRGC